jgi:hypothetical protein
METILNNDNLFIQYQLDHYFQKYNNIITKFSYLDAINDYINHAKENKHNFLWIEVIKFDSIDIYFLENSNIQNIMSHKDTLLQYYNSDIIKDQTKLIISSIKTFPFLILRTGWDLICVTINQPCILRTSIRENNDFGVLIPDSSTQKIEVLSNYKKLFKNINFKNKKNIICWRGALNGIDNEKKSDIFIIKSKNKDLNFIYYSRLYFVNKFCDDHDIKFILTNSEVMKSREIKISTKASSDFLDPTYMAETYKFQVALNGNSFAGSFGWNLLSNSIVFHPDYKDDFYTYVCPRKNIDYINIRDDYEDLNDKYNYYTKNLDEAELIANNGKKYMDNLLRLTPKLTEITMNKIYDLYDQNTLNYAVKLMNINLTKVSVKLTNNLFKII